MFLALTDAELASLKRYLEASEDAEQLRAAEWVLDLYEGETPVSVDMVFEAKKGGLRIDGAALLLYDEGEDGWYMGARLDSAEALRQILSDAGAFAR